MRFWGRAVGVGCTGSSLQHLTSPAAMHRLSCPTAYGLLVPRPGMKPVSPAVEGKFLTTGPPGKSQEMIFFKEPWNLKNKEPGKIIWVNKYTFLLSRSHLNYVWCKNYDTVECSSKCILCGALLINVLNINTALKSIILSHIYMKVYSQPVKFFTDAHAIITKAFLNS